jgi:serine/threonine protein phosphatase PrpC
LRKSLPVIESSGLSATGPVRQDNQDAIHMPDKGCPADAGQLFAVADGMGGYSAGGVASAMAIEKLIEALPYEEKKLSRGNLRRGVEYANLSVYRAAERMGAGRMGTTLTAAYIREDDLQLVHVGDSRAYLVREQRATCLTTDHTTVGEMVRMKLLPPEKVRTHAQRSILTRAIGIGMFVKADITHIKLKEGDCLILCSDGVWSVIQDDEFARIVTESRRVDQVSRKLVELALSRESDDNASVVAIHIRELSPASAKPRGPSITGWLQKRRKMAR